MATNYTKTQCKNKNKIINANKYFHLIISESKSQKETRKVFQKLNQQMNNIAKGKLFITNNIELGSDTVRNTQHNYSNSIINTNLNRNMTYINNNNLQLNSSIGSING